jgi:hypothetical protein
MRKAELSWRRELATKTIADIKAAVEKTYPDTDQRTRRWFA